MANRSVGTTSMMTPTSTFEKKYVCEKVLAASKNKISTLKAFPYLPALEHFHVEENPILKISHLEAAVILLVGPTLKKFNDRNLSREEISIAKRYPSHTGLCIRGNWDLCRPK